MKLRKSKSLRKVSVKTPGGKTVIHYKPKVGKVPLCPVTGQRLHGIKRTRPFQARKVPKSARTVARPHGGMLSSWASKRYVIAQVRDNQQE